MSMKRSIDDVGGDDEGTGEKERAQAPRRSGRLSQRKANPATFWAQAWVSVRAHYNAAQTSNQNAVEAVRDEGTVARVTCSDGVTTCDGRSGSDAIHAESVAYDDLWNAKLEAAQARKRKATNDELAAAALQPFVDALDGGSVCCIYADGTATHKASCFMCTAIAHTLGVTVEKKDTRGYTQYNLPSFFRQDPSDTLFKVLVGATAHTEFALMSPAQKNEIYIHLGSELYLKHKGPNATFNIGDDESDNSGSDNDDSN